VNVQKVLHAYGLWLAGVLSAAAAALWLLRNLAPDSLEEWDPAAGEELELPDNY